MKLIEAANNLLSRGINVLAIDGQKKPIHDWKILQTQFADKDNLPKMFQQAKGIATINGQISGGLLTFDFEGKSHGVGCVFDRWLLQIRSQSEVLANKLICHTTAGGGVTDVAIPLLRSPAKNWPRQAMANC